MAESRGIQPPASVWLTPRTEPVRKAAPAGLDRRRIVAAAVRLLDADGLGKFSMRRLAAELGVSAMSVYWYVDNKDDLLELVLDAVCGEIELPPGVGAGPGAGAGAVSGAGQEGTAGAAGREGGPGGAGPAAASAVGSTAAPAPGEADWRDELRSIARGLRAVLVTHSWAPKLIGEYLNIGPNALALSSAAQRVLARSGLPRELLPGALSAVFQFVHGFGTVEGRWAERCREAGMSEDGFYRAVLDKVRGRPEFERQIELTERRNTAGIEELRERDFEFALDVVIAGIEVMSGRRSKG